MAAASLTTTVVADADTDSWAHSEAGARVVLLAQLVWAMSAADLMDQQHRAGS